MKNINRAAFSLIELMIVITIIGILAAVAVPSYQNYVMKAKISEGLHFAASLKPIIVEYVAVNGAFPPHLWSDFTKTDPTPIIDRINWLMAGSTGVMEIVYESSFYSDNPGGLAAMTLDATLNADGTITWTCANHGGTTYNFPTEYLPAGCNNVSAWPTS